MYLPAWSEPTNETALIDAGICEKILYVTNLHFFLILQNSLRSSQMKLTESWAPWITLTTPFGQPASLSISISSIVAPGTRSDGFTIDVLPVVMATGKNHSGIIAGKLNGAIPAVTPSGSDNEYVSMSLAIFGTISPICKLVMLHICSTTSVILKRNNETNQWKSVCEQKSSSFENVAKSYEVRAKHLPRHRPMSFPAPW